MKNINRLPIIILILFFMMEAVGAFLTIGNFETGFDNWTDTRSANQYNTFSRDTTHHQLGAYSLLFGGIYGQQRKGTGTFTEEYASSNFVSPNISVWLYIPNNNTYQNYNYVRLSIGNTTIDANLSMRDQWQQVFISSYSQNVFKISYQIYINPGLYNGDDIPIDIDNVSIYPIYLNKPNLTKSTSETFTSCSDQFVNTNWYLNNVSVKNGYVNNELCDSYTLNDTSNFTAWNISMIGTNDMGNSSMTTWIKSFSIVYGNQSEVNTIIEAIQTIWWN